MDPQTRAEYKRIKAGPHQGWFTLLHHNGPILEWSDNVMQRVNFVMIFKPLNELYNRLRHIHHIEQSEVDEFWGTPETILEKYVPDHSWSGTAILQASGSSRIHWLLTGDIERTHHVHLY